MGSSIYALFIFLPLLIFAIILFIFSSQLGSALTNQQYLLNCPYPISNAVIAQHSVGNMTVSEIQVVGTVVEYNLTYGNANQTDKGTFFQCSIGNGVVGGSHDVFAQQKPYGAYFAGIPYGQIAFVGDTIWVATGKLQPILVEAYMYFNAPAQVTGLTFFQFVEGFLLLMVGIGVFLAIRSGS